MRTINECVHRPRARIVKQDTDTTFAPIGTKQPMVTFHVNRGFAYSTRHTTRSSFTTSKDFLGLLPKCHPALMLHTFNGVSISGPSGAVTRFSADADLVTKAAMSNNRPSCLSSFQKTSALFTFSEEGDNTGGANLFQLTGGKRTSLSKWRAVTHLNAREMFASAAESSLLLSTVKQRGEGKSCLCATMAEVNTV